MKKPTLLSDLAVRRALEIAGVEFIDENGGGTGVRLSNSSIKTAAVPAFACEKPSRSGARARV